MAPVGRAGLPPTPEQAAGAREGAVLILLFPAENGEWFFPLIQRHDYGGTHSGQISLPGGKRDPGDDTLLATALRETSEEIGVRVGRSSVIGRLSSIFIPPSNFLVEPWLAWLPHRPGGMKPEPREVEKIYELPVDIILEEAHRDHGPIGRGMPRAGRDWEVPHFQWQGRQIWGATAMILSELADIWPE